MKTLRLAILCTAATAAAAVASGPVVAAVAIPVPVALQAATSIERLSIVELAGSWVEPVSQTDDGEVETYGTENVVEIYPDGKFNDALELRFRFRSNPEYDGTYRVTSQGVVSIGPGTITWHTERVRIVPEIPADASEAKRKAMQFLADEIAKGMVGTETYPIVSYSGRELVMNASAFGSFDEYVMTRR